MTNDPYQLDRERKERNEMLRVQLMNLNIGANGRWFVISLVAIAIAAGSLKFAFAFALLLGVSVILEQLPHPARMGAAIVFYVLTALIALTFAAVGL